MSLGDLVQLFNPKRNARLLFKASYPDLPVVDGLVALAAFMMSVHHCNARFNYHADNDGVRGVLFRLASQAEVAVDIGFALAGLIAGYRIFTEMKETGTIKLGRFYGKRLLWLVPGFYAALMIMVPIGGHQLKDAIPSMLYVVNFHPVPDNVMIMSVAITIDMQIFLVIPPLLPLLMKARPSTRVPILVAAFVVALVVRALIIWNAGFVTPPPPSPFEEYWPKALCPPWARCSSQLFGVLTAYLLVYTDVRAWLRRHAGAVLVMTLLLAAAIVACLTVDYDTDPHGRVGAWWFFTFYLTVYAVAISFAALVMSSDVPGTTLLARIARSRVWYPISRLGYAIFLVQFIPIELMAIHMVPGIGRAGFSTFWLASYSVMAIALIWVCAALMFLVVQRPFVNLANLIWPRRGV